MGNKHWVLSRVAMWSALLFLRLFCLSWENRWVEIGNCWRRRVARVRPGSMCWQCGWRAVDRCVLYLGDTCHDLLMN